MRTIPTITFLLVLLACSAPAGARFGTGEYPREHHSALDKIRAKHLSELGESAIRFSSEPALGGPSTVVEVRPDRNSRYKVTINYLSGHPSSGWEKLGAFHFWISADDFAWLLDEVERAEREDGVEDGGTESDGDIMICTDGPGYVSELRSKGRSRWISGFCGRNANNTIAPLMARLVRYGTSIMVKHLGDGGFVPLRDHTDL